MVNKYPITQMGTNIKICTIMGVTETMRIVTRAQIQVFQMENTISTQEMENTISTQEVINIHRKVIQAKSKIKVHIF